jgi:NAD(P)-dependent dehydrogenase (short-subunit alcohol dehydrogenase family)
MRPLDEQTILVTGASDGLGKRVTQELVARGATVIVHGRDPRKTEAAAEEIGSEHTRVADLASLADVRQLADEVDELDTLVNNAGVIVPERTESADGYELTFAVNYLSHFLLTELLLPKLREPARIVNVSSIGQDALDFDDLMYERDYNFFFAYARSKLAQVLFTMVLAERLAGREISRQRPSPRHADGHEDGYPLRRQTPELCGGGGAGGRPARDGSGPRRGDGPLLRRHARGERGRPGL